MTERCEAGVTRAFVRLLAHASCVVLLLLAALGCSAQNPQDEMVGVGMTGIDHLEDHLSIQDFWVDGYNGAQAGKGGRTVCCAMLPPAWRPGITVQVRWGISNWRDRTYSMHERAVPVERYEVPGHVWVHFLRDGSVRVVSSNLAAWKQHADYPGPHDAIPQKSPWKEYPLAPGQPSFRKVPDASDELVK